MLGLLGFVGPLSLLAKALSAASPSGDTVRGLKKGAKALELLVERGEAGERKELNRLGINPDYMEWAKGEKFVTLSLPEEKLPPCQKHLAGEYHLLESEAVVFLDWLRHDSLDHGEGVYSETASVLLMKMGATLEDVRKMRTLWDETGKGKSPLWFKEVSDRRKASPTYQRMSGK